MPLDRLRRIAPATLAPRVAPGPLGEAIRISWTTDTHYKQSVGNDPDAPNAIVDTRHYYTVPDKLSSFVQHVNETTPHAVLATGDLIEDGRYFADWRAYWDQITAPGTTKLWVPGNHDFSYTVPGGSTFMDTTASDMGVAANPVTGGSKFNQAVVISNGTFDARVLLLDTNRDPAGGGGDDRASVKGTLPDDTMTWIQDQLATCPENVVLTASHHGPHTYAQSEFFRFDHAQNLKDVVEAAITARPGLSVTSLFGHNHIQNMVNQYGTLGRKFPGVLAAALVELEQASSTDLYVFSNGALWWELIDLQYPFVA